VQKHLFSKTYRFSRNANRIQSTLTLSREQSNTSYSLYALFQKIRSAGFKVQTKRNQRRTKRFGRNLHEIRSAANFQTHTQNAKFVLQPRLLKSKVQPIGLRSVFQTTLSFKENSLKFKVRHLIFCIQVTDIHNDVSA
jgi:hypothetical protein